MGGSNLRYKFRYFNGSFKLLNSILIPLQNLLFPPIVALIVLRVITLVRLGEYFNNDIVINAIQKIVLFCSFSWTIVYCAFKKGVFLNDKCLIIARYTITLRNWKNRIVLRYDEVENVNVNYNDLRFTAYHGSLLVPFGDNTYNVEITMKNGKKYFFSIENQEEFCDNLNFLIQKNRT